MEPTYEAFDTFLVRRGRPLTKRPIDRNTWAVRLDDGAIAVRLHTTDIVTYWSDGRVLYRTGGWDTDTTQRRMNDYGPFKVSGPRRGQHAGEWVVHLRGEERPFQRYEEFSAEETLFAKIMRASGTTENELAEARENLPLCARAMACLCAGHARGNPASAPCDTSEEE